MASKTGISRRRFGLAALCVLVLVGLAGAVYSLASGSPKPSAVPLTASGQIPLAILGDSDSHSYGDMITFEAGSPYRGGKYRPWTLQWPEALHRLRGPSLDLGPWGTWGYRLWPSRIRRVLSWEARAPHKQDFRHNFAWSGAGCADLVEGSQRQVTPLIHLIQEHPDRWREGVVILRIGVNDFGHIEALRALAEDPSDLTVGASIEACLRAIEQSLDRLRDAAPQLKIVLVGIFDNVHWAPHLDLFRSTREREHISQGLDRFDTGLRQLAAQNAQIVFFDDRSWFARHFGGRDAEGRPDYRSKAFAPDFTVTNTQGNSPEHLVLADGHAGLVWNVLWAQALVDVLRDDLNVDIEPIHASEIVRLVNDLRGDAQAALGARPPTPPSDSR